MVLPDSDHRLRVLLCPHHILVKNFKSILLYIFLCFLILFKKLISCFKLIHSKFQFTKICVHILRACLHFLIELMSSLLNVNQVFGLSKCGILKFILQLLHAQSLISFININWLSRLTHVSLRCSRLEPLLPFSVETSPHFVLHLFCFLKVIVIQALFILLLLSLPLLKDSSSFLLFVSNFLHPWLVL